MMELQVHDAYRKWWKVKVAESEFLSKHFGEKLPTTSNPNTVPLVSPNTVPLVSPNTGTLVRPSLVPRLLLRERG